MSFPQFGIEKSEMKKRPEMDSKHFQGQENHPKKRLTLSKPF
jgi:hypothetical protein